MLRNDQINGIGFVVNDRPIAVYGPNLRQNSQEYTKSFDASFWVRQLELASTVTTDEMTHDHVAFLRQILSHAEEHLFALIFAILQAPFCPDLWLYKYKPSDLPQMVSRVLEGGHVLNRFRQTETSWQSIVRVMWGGLEEKRYDLTCKVIDRLARHFVSEYARDEYNGIKHGLRLALGGLSISFAPGGSPDKVPEPENYIPIASAQYGSNFYSFKSLPRAKDQFRAVRRFSNWHLEVIAHQLRHTVMLIENMGIPLRIFTEVEGDRTFQFMQDEREYELDPCQSDRFFQMESFTDFDIPTSDRINLRDVKSSYT